MPRIEYKEEDCIGCGTCSSLCDNWEMDYDKNKAHCKNLNPEEVGCNKEAADNCPSNCIHVIEDE